jgi:hypothetical protein
MDYIQLFDNVKRYTGMHIGETYGEASAFVYGCDAGNHYGLLHGFHEWLIVRLNGYNNLSWHALVLHVAFPNETVQAEDILGSKEKTRHAINTLFDLLTEFLHERDSPDGLMKIFERYFAWLRKQSWYVPASESGRQPPQKRRGKGVSARARSRKPQ